MNDLVYTGKIVDVTDIKDADRIKLVTAVCGKGGKWHGIMPIADSICGADVIVFQPDSILPGLPGFDFMKKYHMIVKQRRFKGVPSEALIMPKGVFANIELTEIGTDVTALLGVKKYEKPGGNWETEGSFPPFLRKTDEVNFQRVPEMVERMRSMTVMVTIKMDGMSTTAYQRIDPITGEKQFGVCSRNLQVKEGDNPHWRVANKYKLRETLPAGMALQWETCGPKIQGNPMGLTETDGYAFDYFDIVEHRYRAIGEQKLMPFVPFLAMFKPGQQPADWQEFAAGCMYSTGAAAEGIVVRPLSGIFDTVDGEYQRFSFKVINLLYKN